MILGDNMFDTDFTSAIQNFQGGGKVFAKEVSDPERFGVVKFDDQLKAVEIVEKPKTFLSNHALTGMYIFDNNVVKIAKNVQPSERGEIEITEIMNWYLKKGELDVEIIDGQWIDAGTFESYYKANQWAYEKSQKE